MKNPHIIFVGIVFVLMSGYLWLYGQDFVGDQAPTTPSSPPVPIADENLKTYQGPGFELSIPSDWQQHPERPQQLARSGKEGYYLNFNSASIRDMNDARLKGLYTSDKLIEAEMQIICGGQAEPCATTLDSRPLALQGATGIEFTLRYLNTPTNEVPIISIEELHRVFVKEGTVYRFWTSNITWVDKSRVLDPDPFIVFRQILDTLKLQ